jgi:hypothetical protein
MSDLIERLGFIAIDNAEVLTEDEQNTLSEAATLLSEPARRGKDEWQTMDSAPKDGSEFIARTAPEFSAFSCFWDSSAFVHYDKDDGFIRYSPKEWMPFPRALHSEVR